MFALDAAGQREVIPTPTTDRAETDGVRPQGSTSGVRVRTPAASGARVRRAVGWVAGAVPAAHTTNAAGRVAATVVGKWRVDCAATPGGEKTSETIFR